MDSEKSRRIKKKGLLCIIGLVLLIVIGVMQLQDAQHNDDDEQLPDTVQLPEYIPTIEWLSNVWITEITEDGILCFYDDEEASFQYAEGTYITSEVKADCLADVELTDGLITKLQLKNQKVSGKVLSVGKNFVELDGKGFLAFSEDCRGYRLFKELKCCQSDEIPVGYDFTDFVMENGEVCGFLIAKEDSMEQIRVLIKNSDYAGIMHESLLVEGDSDFEVFYYDDGVLTSEWYPAGDVLEIQRDSMFFADENNKRILIQPKAVTGKLWLKNVNRAQKASKYRGKLEVLCTMDGLAVINELPLEEYLFSVVPSEMPATYPREALKAQAVCARTYAYGRMLHAGYPNYGAHVDDSTTYQVYNNILEQESTTKAVKETYGQVLFTGTGELAETYYYSTSCGIGSDAHVWKTKAADLLDYITPKQIAPSSNAEETEGETGQMVRAEDLCDEEQFALFIETDRPEDYEYEEPWYRWSYQVEELDVVHLYEVIKKRYQARQDLVLVYDKKKKQYVSREPKEFNTVEELAIEKRGLGGVADELVIKTDKEQLKVISEHNIRYVLCDGYSKVIRKDGSKVDAPYLLPSGYFVMEISEENGQVVGYSVNGGGYGHGVGMSQNGAKTMALAGLSMEDIINCFYDGCYVKSLYEEPGNAEEQ